MCIFGGGGKSPTLPPPVAPPAPTPTPTPEIVSGVDEGSKRRKLLQQRAGFAATLKTGPRGIFGQGAQLTAPGKSTLG